jgi:hypothetical protein
LRTSAFKTLKTTALAPIPSASVTSAVRAKPGDLRNWRRAYFTSVNISGLSYGGLLSGADSVLGTRVLSGWFQQIMGHEAILKTEKLEGKVKCTVFADRGGCPEMDGLGAQFDGSLA